MTSRVCPLCDSGSSRVALQGAYVLGERSMDLVRCQGCGLIRVEPMPDPDEVRGLYNETYFERDFSCGVRKGTYLESEAMRVEEYRDILSVIHSFRPAGRLLEVGCAAGSFLNYARRVGYDVEGVDISSWASRMADEQFGIRVHVGRLMEVHLPEESFEVAFLGDLLEHEPDPVPLMAEIRRLLKPLGIVAVKVPTYVNSFYFRAMRKIPRFLLNPLLDSRLLQAMKLAHPAPNLPPYHVYEYSRRTASQLCEKVGLRVVSHRTSLLLPEFLVRWNATPLDRMAYGTFALMKAIMVKFNLPAGHVLILAQKG